MIDFLRYRWLYFLISLSVLLPGAYSLVRWQLKPAIDFTGGNTIEIKNEKPASPAGGLKMKNYNSKLKNILTNNQLEVISLQNANEGVVIKTKPAERERWNKVKEELTKEFGEIEEVRFESVGPILGKEHLEKTIYAATLAVLGILIFIALSFRDLKYGISAIVALLHDLLILLGSFSLLGRFYGVEVDTLFVTAALTTMSFSVHDTIVVFDRIRESLKEEGNYPFNFLVNKALTETMSRSLNNSLTIIFMLLALVLMGGASIKWFIVALLIGTISGTYSSPFVAAPILVLLTEKSKERSKVILNS